MTRTGERDAAFTLRAVKVHIRPRRNKEACEEKCTKYRNKVEKELACILGERRRAAKCFASRGPEWLSPNRKRSTTHRSFAHNFLQCYQIAGFSSLVRQTQISRVRKLFRPHLIRLLAYNF